MQAKYNIICFLIGILLKFANGDNLDEGDSCLTKSGQGVCKVDCPELEAAYDNGTIRSDDIKNCGFTIKREIICCPIETTTNAPATTKAPAPQNNIIGDNTTTPKPKKERAAVIACHEFEEDLGVFAVEHILNGVEVKLGEYPHMAAIGFPTVGNDLGPYDFRCGGTLIAKRFVLTAAHCLTDRSNQPAIVRLGLVNLEDVNQLEDAQDIPINKSHIPQNFSSPTIYNDIGILELERDVNFTFNVFPTCLYTELNDPQHFTVSVAGWGTTETGTNSKILLKTELDIISVHECNERISQDDFGRKIPFGIKNTQLCAHKPNKKNDACQGDSGGPLNLILDADIRKYRIVGVVSAGIGCGSATPGFYTRVASYLDWIEEIVWPDLVKETRSIQERAAVKACREIQKYFGPTLVPHIMNGKGVKLGEFPHMAAIGFPKGGNDFGPYDYRCGGTLIANRFVLTAAHCVKSRPVIVRLGLVNLTDESQQMDAQDIRIKTTHVHPSFSLRTIYNDIGILELDRDVEINDRVFPTCLYTESNNPPNNNLYVSGWGKTNDTDLKTSDILLKTELSLVSINDCNNLFKHESRLRFPGGIKNTQICAYKENETNDACKGDSGGPLILVLNADTRNFRVVGVVSSGLRCGTMLPGLYTNVTSYLDWIESIVWPDLVQKIQN